MRDNPGMFSEVSESQIVSSALIINNLRDMLAPISPDALEGVSYTSNFLNSFKVLTDQQYKAIGDLILKKSFSSYSRQLADIVRAIVPKGQNITLEHIYDLNPFDFEKLVADVIKRISLNSTEKLENIVVTPRSNDRGIDILYDVHGDFHGGLGCAQVKLTRRPVGRPLIHQLMGAREDYESQGRKVSYAAFYTMGRYTSDAVECARRNNIKLVDGSDFMALLSKADIKRTTDIGYAPHNNPLLINNVWSMTRLISAVTTIQDASN